jgi:hypothetical protein
MPHAVGVYSSFLFLYNSFHDAAAHTIAGGTTKNARDRMFWLRSFAFSGKIKKGIDRVLKFCFIGNGCHTWLQGVI